MVKLSWKEYTNIKTGKMGPFENIYPKSPFTWELSVFDEPTADMRPAHDVYISAKVKTIKNSKYKKRKTEIQMSLGGVKTDERVSAVQIAGIGKL